MRAAYFLKIIGFSFSLHALAWEAKHHCDPDHLLCDTQLLSRQYRAHGECQIAQPMQLARGLHDFPTLGRLDVEYWQGRYALTVEVTELWRRSCYNACTWEKVASNELSPAPYFTAWNFAIDNPNLHDDTAASFELVPLTGAEAGAAFVTAKQNCEKARGRVGQGQ